MSATRTKTTTKMNTSAISKPSLIEPRVARALGVLRGASEPSRLAVLSALAKEGKNIRMLCEELGEAQPKLSHDLAILRQGALIGVRREGRQNVYHLTKGGLQFIALLSTLGTAKGKFSNPVLSDSEFKKLVKKVGTVVDDPEGWLKTPNPQFENRRPIDLIGTDDEVRVHIIVEAAQQGFFS
jgi:ArsR family transcriptional regulator, arsenate/arsenite/antimonite-responsive transcriptional repressor